MELKCLETNVFVLLPQLANMNVEAQRVERELRDELADSVSKSVSDADRARITELEKAEAELRVEVSKYVDRPTVLHHRQMMTRYNLN